MLLIAYYCTTPPPASGSVADGIPECMLIASLLRWCTAAPTFCSSRTASCPIRRWMHPRTRAFDGCQTLYCIQNQEDPEVVLIVEQWDSRQHYERYLAWRAERGDMEVFGAMMAGPPNIRFFDYFRV